MSIYRTIDGRRRIVEWCEAGLERWPDHDRHTFESPLGPTHVTSAGDGSEALVWIPGTNFNAAMHDDLAHRLVDDGTFRLHVVDLPGQPGLSSDVRLGRDRLERYGQWLPSVLQQIDDGSANSGPITLVGHSLGAAITLASAPTNQVGRLILLSPAGLCKLRITSRLLRITIPWMFRPTTERAARLARYMAHPASPPFDRVTEMLELAARHTKPDGSPPPLASDTITRWRGRAQVVTGDRDPFLPPSRLREPARRHLDTGVAVIADAGHLIPDEQPDQLVKLLTAGL